MLFCRYVSGIHHGSKIFYCIIYLIITGILDPILHWGEPGAAVRGEGALQNDRQVHHPASEEQGHRQDRAGSLQHGKGEDNFASK